MRRRLVLASASARRRRILEQLGLDFDVRAPHIDEGARSGEAPADAVIRLASSKARSHPSAPRDLIVAADTVVVLEGEILGKPLDEDDALVMLARLTGRQHLVYTGLALAADGRLEAAVEVTGVWFRALDEAERAEYVATGEPFDKAGAYGIQGFGAAIVERIEGDYFNVMGLPVQRFQELLSRFGLRYAFGSIVERGSAG